MIWHIRPSKRRQQDAVHEHITVSSHSSLESFNRSRERPFDERDAISPTAVAVIYLFGKYFQGIAERVLYCERP